MMNQQNVTMKIHQITNDNISENIKNINSSLNSKNVLLLFSDNDKNVNLTSDKVWDNVTRIFNSSDEFMINSSVDNFNNNNNSFIDVNNNNELNNWWAMLAVVLVIGTAAGNVLVCLAISWERKLQNVTNYFLMSLAITDLMVAILVMPLGVLTLVRGYFPLASVYCLAWICLDVLFCTASIMHLCTISVDRYLSLRYPMKFGRNKTRRRVILKIIFVWLLSIAMSLPLSLMYSKF
ncbi:hypothetical protein HCN44_010574 [Aphidius gifuensis]|uniref:G-protein coupled receptors family 1 profile domain-containing protein n=1 Tax=Aphidius gifuensis TaxID=684658 RepID=A0A835CS04_APHGI|nr:hypothetical protein HCN44_010574 [Aphidius gifuensis]